MENKLKQTLQANAAFQLAFLAEITHLEKEEMLNLLDYDTLSRKRAQLQQRVLKFLSEL